MRVELLQLDDVNTFQNTFAQGSQSTEHGLGRIDTVGRARFATVCNAYRDLGRSCMTMQVDFIAAVTNGRAVRDRDVEAVIRHMEARAGGVSQLTTCVPGYLHSERDGLVCSIPETTYWAENGKTQRT